MSNIYRITTVCVIVPDHLQRDTGLPHDPQGDIRTGYAATKKELLDLARLDRSEATAYVGSDKGRPNIEKVRWNEEYRAYEEVRS